MSSWLAKSDRTQWPEEDDHNERNDTTLVSDESGGIDGNAEEQRPEPTGEHLMVDIKNVDGAFLNSEPRLARAIIDLVKEADLLLLSYHCHGFSPAGVSCVGVLHRNYIAFHTWPEAGVITFDLVAAESKSILPLLPAIEQLFGVPRTPSYPGQVVEQPKIRWAHKLRGFRHDSIEISNHLFSDLGKLFLGNLGTELKEKVSRRLAILIMRLDCAFRHSALCFHICRLFPSILSFSV